MAKLCGERKLVRCFYCTAELPKNQPAALLVNPDTRAKHAKFVYRVRRMPYFELRLGRLAYRERRAAWISEEGLPEEAVRLAGVSRQEGKGIIVPHLVEKGVDVRLATDMVAKAHKRLYDVAILVSGDGDFADAVQEVKDVGLHVEVACFSDRLHSARFLQDVCDKFIELTEDFFEDCWYNK